MTKIKYVDSCLDSLYSFIKLIQIVFQVPSSRETTLYSIEVYLFSIYSKNTTILYLHIKISKI